MSPGKVIANTANVSTSMTAMAMLHIHQSRRSSFRKPSCISGRRSSRESPGWRALRVGSDDFMFGGEFRVKFEIRGTSICPVQIENRRKKESRVSHRPLDRGTGSHEYTIE